MIESIVYPESVLIFDSTKSAGMPRKMLDVSRIHALGWTHRNELRDGISCTYGWLPKKQTALSKPQVGLTA